MTKEYRDKSTSDLIKIRNSYLECVNDVTNPTGVMIIRELSDIDAELERRALMVAVEFENIPQEELEAAAEFYDKIMVEGKDFYKGKKLMPGQD